MVNFTVWKKKVNAFCIIIRKVITADWLLFSVEVNVTQVWPVRFLIHRVNKKWIKVVSNKIWDLKKISDSWILLCISFVELHRHASKNFVAAIEANNLAWNSTLHWYNPHVFSFTLLINIIKIVASNKIWDSRKIKFLTGKFYIEF